jgi:hypothetical protein
MFPSIEGNIRHGYPYLVERKQLNFIQRRTLYIIEISEIRLYS